MSQTKTIAFFGATGGCTAATLVQSIKAGYTCSALARTPEKLIKLLESHGITNEQTTKHLRIVSGNAKSVESITETITDPSTNQCVDTIIYGIGAAPVFKGMVPSIDDPNVCGSTSEALIEALTALKPANPPLISIISTTGINDGARDVPIALVPLYHWLLKVPHIDKKKLEENIRGAPSTAIRGYVIVRPTLLMDSARTHGKLRAGYEGRAEASGNGRLTLEEGGTGWKGTKGMALGHIVGRSNVGAWVYEEVIVNGGGEWVGKNVTLA